jgi:hypothetical protein
VPKQSRSCWPDLPADKAVSHRRVSSPSGLRRPPLSGKSRSNAARLALLPLRYPDHAGRSLASAALSTTRAIRSDKAGSETARAITTPPDSRARSTIARSSRRRASARADPSSEAGGHFLNHPNELLRISALRFGVRAHDVQHASMAMYNAWCDRVPVVLALKRAIDVIKSGQPALLDVVMDQR